LNRWLAVLDRSAGILSARHRLVVWVLLALFAGNALLAAALNSGACDELGAHIPSGYLFATTGKFSGGIDNFPLGQLWIALAAALGGIDYPLWTERHLILFRLPVIALGVLTCWLVYRLARALFGEGPALGALFFAALCPNLLAHGSLATLDLPATAGILGAVYALWRYVEHPSVRRMTVLSLALAAASLVKVQAILLYPYVALVLALLALGPLRSRSDAPTRPAGPPLRPSTYLSWSLIPVCWFVLTNLSYLHLPGPGGSLLPPLYLRALAGLQEHGRQGHFAYLAGKYSQEGWWYFFPAAVLFKTPLSLLLPFVVALVRRWSLREALFLLLPIALFLGAAMTSRINIGLRHVLAIYPFLAIGAAAGAARLWQAAGNARVWLRSAVLLLLAAYAFHAATIAPHFLSYFNLLAGGPKNGHRYLVDSNFDWGTNDRFLRRFVEKSGRSWQIDPFAFRPTDGPILVNANALYGVLNGREKAYEWLKRYRPEQQIAYTWFAYEVPPGAFPRPAEDEEARLQVIGHLERLAGEGTRIEHPGYGTVLPVPWRRSALTIWPSRSCVG